MRAYLIITFLFSLLLLHWQETLALDYVDIDGPTRFDIPWIKLAKNNDQAILVLFSGLSRSVTGKKLLQKASLKASQKGLTLSDVVKPADGSLTDTTLVRRFLAASPLEVTYQTRSQIMINRHLNVADALLDLAHELTHYVLRGAFNPYQQNGGPKDFIAATIEGKGGEVDAYLVECQVYKELFSTSSFQGTPSKCPLIEDGKGGFSRQKANALFYKMGPHYAEFQKQLEKYSLKLNDLPLASDGQAIFISSAWGIPYPMAAMQEYQSIMERACQNDWKRLELVKGQLQRSIASVGQKQFDGLFQSYQGRCEKFISLQSSAQIR